MRAYQGIILKEEFIKELEWHYEQDNFVKGDYFENGKGCAVGCSLESISRKKNIEIKFYDHSKYPELLGIPQWLAYVEDAIFEGLEDSLSKEWPLRFSRAIKTGADLEKVKAPFLIFTLESNLERLKDDKFKEQRNAVQRCIKLWQRNDLYSIDWRIERLAAKSAAESAACSADWSAMLAADSAACSATLTEWSVAKSAAEAARSAAEAARLAAEAAAYKSFSDKLIELIEKQNPKGKND